MARCKLRISVLLVLLPLLLNGAAGTLRPKVINTAKKYLGVPYKFGGTTPSGFDCSGYMWYIFAKHGIKIPRNSFKQYSALRAVKQPLPGDLVFFSTYKKGASHVGIWLGDDKFLHAPKTGTPVGTAEFKGYWAKRYLGARTVFDDALGFRVADRLRWRWRSSAGRLLERGAPATIEARFLFGFGGSLEVPLADGFMLHLQPELSFLSVGVDSSDWLPVELDIGAMAAWYPVNTQRFGIHLSAGGVFHVPLFHPGKEPDHQALREMTFALSGGIGIDIYSVTLSFRYELGLGQALLDSSGEEARLDRWVVALHFPL